MEKTKTKKRLDLKGVNKTKVKSRLNKCKLSDLVTKYNIELRPKLRNGTIPELYNELSVVNHPKSDAESRVKANILFMNCHVLKSITTQTNTLSLLSNKKNSLFIVIE